MKKYYKLLILVFAIAMTSCSTSTMGIKNNYGGIYHKTRKITPASEAKKYKRMNACEEKFMRRFSRLYAKQQRKLDNTDVTTPFFSSYYEVKFK